MRKIKETIGRCLIVNLIHHVGIKMFVANNSKGRSMMRIWRIWFDLLLRVIGKLSVNLFNIRSRSFRKILLNIYKAIEGNRLRQRLELKRLNRESNESLPSKLCSFLRFVFVIKEVIYSVLSYDPYKDVTILNILFTV